MSDKFTVQEEKKLLKLFKRNEKQAKKMVNEPSKVQDLLKGAIKMSNEFKGPLEKVGEQLQLFFHLVHDYVKGTYRQVPIGSIVAVIASLTYLLTPLDLIPDVITGLGLFDDIYIINLVFKQVGVDLQKYKDWRTQPIDVIDVIEE